ARRQKTPPSPAADRHTDRPASRSRAPRQPRPIPTRTRRSTRHSRLATRGQRPVQSSPLRNSRSTVPCRRPRCGIPCNFQKRDSPEPAPSPARPLKSLPPQAPISFSSFDLRYFSYSLTRGLPAQARCVSAVPLPRAGGIGRLPFWVPHARFSERGVCLRRGAACCARALAQPGVLCRVPHARFVSVGFFFWSAAPSLRPERSRGAACLPLARRGGQAGSTPLCLRLLKARRRGVRKWTY